MRTRIANKIRKRIICGNGLTARRLSVASAEQVAKAYVRKYGKVLGLHLLIGRDVRWAVGKKK